MLPVCCEPLPVAWLALTSMSSPWLFNLPPPARIILPVVLNVEPHFLELDFQYQYNSLTVEQVAGEARKALEAYYKLSGSFPTTAKVYLRYVSPLVSAFT